MRGLDLCPQQIRELLLERNILERTEDQYIFHGCASALTSAPAGGQSRAETQEPCTEAAGAPCKRYGVDLLLLQGVCQALALSGKFPAISQPCCPSNG